jgi:putative membrane protein
MNIQTPSSGGRLRQAIVSTVGVVALCAATVLSAQTTSSSGSSTSNGSSTSSSATPSYDTSGSAANPRTSSDRTRTGSGGSTSGTGSSYDSATSSSSTGGMAGSNDGSNLARADRRFVTKAAELNTEEVRLSELAAQQASSPEVRSFAQQLVTEHTQASTELSSLASRKGLSAMARDDYDQRAVTKLGKKSGTDFDKAYLDKMVDAHEDAVDLFDKESRHAKDPELQAFASKMLPKLREHQQHARSLEQTISGSSGQSGMSGSSRSSSTSGSGTPTP